MIGTLRLLGANRVNSSILLLERFLACFTLSCAKTKLDLLLNNFGALRRVRLKTYLQTAARWAYLAAQSGTRALFCQITLLIARGDNRFDSDAFPIWKTRVVVGDRAIWQSGLPGAAPRAWILNFSSFDKFFLPDCLCLLHLSMFIALLRVDIFRFKHD